MSELIVVEKAKIEERISILNGFLDDDNNVKIEEFRIINELTFLQSILSAAPSAEEVFNAGRETELEMKKILWGHEPVKKIKYPAYTDYLKSLTP